MAVTLASKVRPGPVFTAAVSCLILAAVLSLESDLDASLADGLMWHIWTHQVRAAHAYDELGGGRRAPLDLHNHSSEAPDPPYDGSAVLAACEGKLDVLFVVRSASENWQRRATFRHALSHAREWHRVEKAAVFLINRPPSIANSSSFSRLWLRLEAKHFGDIAAYVTAENSSDGTDSARLGSARWVVNNCASAPHVVMVDDDVGVDLVLLAQYLKEYAADEGFDNLTIHCNVVGRAVRADDGGNDSSYAIPHRSLAATAGSQHWRCAGHAMLTTPNALRALLEEWRLWEEDADRNRTVKFDGHGSVALVNVRAQRKGVKTWPTQTSRYAKMFTSENAYFKNPLVRSLFRVAPWPLGAKVSCLRKIVTHFLAQDKACEDYCDSTDTFNLLKVIYLMMGIGI